MKIILSTWVQKRSLLIQAPADGPTGNQAEHSQYKVACGFTDNTVLPPLRDQPHTLTLTCAAWHRIKLPQTNPDQTNPY